MSLFIFPLEPESERCRKTIVAGLDLEHKIPYRSMKIRFFKEIYHEIVLNVGPW